MTYQEPKEWTLHGYPVTCTEQQFRTIRLALSATAELRRWHSLDSMLRMQHACSDNLATWTVQMDAARKTADDLAVADQELAVRLNVIINNVVGEP